MKFRGDITLPQIGRIISRRKHLDSFRTVLSFIKGRIVDWRPV